MPVALAKVAFVARAFKTLITEGRGKDGSVRAADR